MTRPTLEETIERQADIISMFQAYAQQAEIIDGAEAVASALRDHVEVLEILLRIQGSGAPAQMESRYRTFQKGVWGQPFDDISKIAPAQQAASQFRTYNPGATYAADEDDRTPRTVVLYANGNVLVFDDQGKQIPELQGRFDKVADQLLRHENLPNIHFQKGVWGESIEDITASDFFNGGMTLFAEADDDE